MYVSLKGDLHKQPLVKICASGKAVTMHQPWLTTAFMEWNALHTVLALGVGGHYFCHSELVVCETGPGCLEGEREELLIEQFGR